MTIVHVRGSFRRTRSGTTFVRQHTATFHRVAGVGEWDHHAGTRVVDGFAVDPPPGPVPPHGWVFRAQSAGDSAAIGAGGPKYVGKNPEDATPYLDWSRSGAGVVVAYPGPDPRDVTHLRSLEDLAQRTGLNLHQMEEVTGLNDALEHPTVRAALMAQGIRWARWNENSGTTLAYLGDEPIPGTVVARQVGRSHARTRDALNRAIDSATARPLKKGVRFVIRVF